MAIALPPATIPARMEPEAPVWERLQDEPSKWYARFCRYRDLGPSRRFVDAYRAEWAEDHPGTEPRQRLGTHWFTMAERWRWKQRVEAFDDAERRREEEDLGQAKLEARRQRIDALLLVKNLAVERLRQAADHGELTAGEAGTLAVKAIEQLRKEMDDEPRRRVQHEGEVDMVMKHKVYVVGPGQPDPMDEL